MEFKALVGKKGITIGKTSDALSNIYRLFVIGKFRIIISYLNLSPRKQKILPNKNYRELVTHLELSLYEGFEI